MAVFAHRARETLALLINSARFTETFNAQLFSTCSTPPPLHANFYFFFGLFVFATTKLIVSRVFGRMSPLGRHRLSRTDRKRVSEVLNMVNLPNIYCYLNDKFTQNKFILPFKSLFLTLESHNVIWYRLLRT